MTGFHTARLATEKADFRPALPMCSMPGLYGADMTKMTYSEQLRHPNWQRKRLDVLNAANFECSNCGDRESTLHVHHKRYVKGRMAWDYAAHELEALCVECHAQQHEHRELLDMILSTGGATCAQAIGLVAGYLECQMALSEDVENDARKVGGPDFILGQIAALLGSTSWPRIGRLIEAARDGTELNPAERVALDFLLNFPEPVKDY